MIRQDFYRKWLFAADLVAVSVWAVFAMRYSMYVSWCVAAVCALRILLCFQLKERTAWAAYSAIAFACAYFFIPYDSGFEGATRTMGYYLWYIFGNHEEVVHFYNGYHGSFPTGWIFALQLFWIAWNTLIPLVVAGKQLFSRPKRIRRKLLRQCLDLIVAEIVLYNLFCGYCSPLWSTEAESIAIILLAALPLMRYLLSAERRNRLLHKALTDKSFNLYLGYTGLFVAAMIIGLREVYTLRLVGLLTAPPLFYILLCRSFALRPIRLADCLMLAASGAVFSAAMGHSHTATLLMLVCGVGIVAWTAMAMVLHNRKSWKAALILCTVIPAALVPMLMGLNPYTVTDATHTRPYCWNIVARSGVYITESDGRFGLRDRYGEILPIQYTHFENLDPLGNYIVVSQPSEYGLDQNVLSVYDLAGRRFIVNEPVNFVITEIEPVDRLHFKLINENGRHFATLRLPGTAGDEYVSDPRIEPHFSDSYVSVEEFLEAANDEVYYPECGTWREMYRANRNAYTLLEQIYNMANVESSPENDLNYARAVHALIKNSLYYRGDSIRAFNEIDALTGYLQAGNTADMTAYARYRRLMASIRLSDTYSSLIADLPYYIDEYVAWHHLMEAIAHYADYKSNSDEWYQCKFMDEDLERAQCLDNRRELLEMEKDVLAGSGLPEGADKPLMTAEDIATIFSNYHSPDVPEYYHPMWNEIKPAFERWAEVREEIAGILPLDEEASYRHTTALVTDRIYHIIAPLDVAWLVPALYRR